MKYSFLMPYKNRRSQFHNTLLSFMKWYGHRDDWEVLLIIDGDEKTNLPSVLCDRIRVTNVIREDINPAPLFNMAAAMSRGDYVIVTNPECYHAADVLGWLDATFENTPDAYAVAACDHVQHPGMLGAYLADFGPRIAYYQHSQHKNNLYHFCSALSKANYLRIGGFDEAFAAGYCFDDDDFRDRVLHAKLHCLTDDSMLVLHQEHSKTNMTPQLRVMWKQNKAIYENNKNLRRTAAI